MKSLSHVQLLATPWTAAYAPPSMGFSRIRQVFDKQFVLFGDSSPWVSCISGCSISRGADFHLDDFLNDICIVKSFGTYRWHHLPEQRAGMFYCSLLQNLWASPVAQMVKNPPAMKETWIPSLVGKIPWRRERLPLQYSGMKNSMGSMGSQRVGHE